MKHITEILEEKGYKLYGFTIGFPNQNADAKSQNRRLIETMQDLVFTKGSANSKEYSFFFPKTKKMDFSSMKVSGIADYWVKDQKFENPIVFGLNEAGKPPTLITPRPKINLIKKDTIPFDRIANYDQRYDDAMNICLQKENHYNIYDALFDKSISFYYDLTPPENS